jgi:hypothetical protein
VRKSVFRVQIRAVWNCFQAFLLPDPNRDPDFSMSKIYI